MGINSALEELARSAGTSVADVLGMLMTWWLSPASGINVESPVIGRLQQLTLPVIATILVASVLVQACRMAVSRRKEPAIDIALGLGRYALVTGLGLTLVRLGLDAGDALSQSLLQDSLPQFTDRIRGVVTAEGQISPFLLLGQALILFVLALIQWIILFFRQAGILVLAAMLGLAASGAINASTRGWLTKIIPWLIALVAYKPIAAFIYAIGLSFIGQADDFTTVMAGILILALAIIALPVMMKFFSWSQVSVTGGGSTGGMAAGAATGAASISAMRSARSMEMSGPGTAGSGSAGSDAASGAAPNGGAASGQPQLGSGGGGGTAGGGRPGGGGGPAGPGGDSGGASGGPVSSGSGGPASGGSAGAGAGGGVGGATGGAAAGGGVAGGGAAAAGVAAGGPAAAAAQGAQHVARTARSVAEQATSPPESGPSAGPSGSDGSSGSGPSGSDPTPRR